jgi:oxygen-independent coproporphyrinogen III oxidase
MRISCYIHVPFCARICTYCDFYRIVHDPEWESRYVEAICREIELRFAGLNSSIELETLYFGGGTPTVLGLSSWQKIVAHVTKHAAFAPDIEFTTEANPESSTPDKLQFLKSLGVNRISFGAQSFAAANLQRLGRLHSAEQVGIAVATARNCGIDNVSIDLMYGLPDETDASFDSDLRQVVALNPQHISFYSLMLEGGVPLRYQVQRREVDLPPDDTVADRYLRAAGILEGAGFEHYEISNYAHPGRRCRHNLAYWQHRDYIAFGPAAVGTLGDKRYKNEPDIFRYVKNLAQGKLPASDLEDVGPGKRLIETIMLSLRLSSGVDLVHLHSAFGYDLCEQRKELLSALADEGDIEISQGTLKLTTRGMFRSDMIASSLLPDFV